MEKNFFVSLLFTKINKEKKYTSIYIYLLYMFNNFRRNISHIYRQSYLSNYRTMSSSANRPIVISGPSGTGKSTLLKNYLLNIQINLIFSFKHHQKPRPGEVNGKDYNFSTVEEFKQLIDENKFIEWAQFSGNYYGTTIKAVKDVAEQGRTCLLDIDMQGLNQLRKPI